MVFHLREDHNAQVEERRALRREDWAISWLVQHNPDRARSYVLEESEEEEEPTEDQQAQQFLIEDRWFSDRRSLGEVLGLGEEENDVR